MAFKIDVLAESYSPIELKVKDKLLRIVACVLAERLLFWAKAL
ncbi:MAG: hypothetical protein O9294_15925 [Cytophagales bacterium]|nr:hypothetical protein [Cytophagales bacterium]